MPSNKNTSTFTPADMADFLTDLNQKSTQQAAKLFQQGARSHALQIILFPIGRFFYSYFLNREILKGTTGFVHAILMSFETFLTRSKLYLLEKQSSHRR